MADKSKTYPMQIQELKEQLTEKTDQLNEALQRLSFVEEMQGEISHLRDQLANTGRSDTKVYAETQAKMTDLQQAADSNAAIAKQYMNKSKDLEQQVEQLESQLDLLGKERFKVIDTQSKLDLTSESLKTANLQIINLNNRLREVAGEKEKIIEQQSRELQTLRMRTATQEKILYQVRDALNNAPDVIGSLKYIVGINGSGSV